MDIDEVIMEINSLIKMVQEDNIDRIISHKIEHGYCIKIPDDYFKSLMNIGVFRDNISLDKITNSILNDIKAKLNDQLKKYFY